MGRKADPRGKDRPRTIVLSGDVAEIAQDLADKSQLSAVLSELLRQSYGISDDVKLLKNALIATTDERKKLQERELELEAEIRNAEDRLIHQQNHILPSLYQRQGILEERMKRLQKEHAAALDPTTSRLKSSQLQATSNQLHKVLDEIKLLEAGE